jgi:hypothetical protein
MSTMSSLTPTLLCEISASPATRATTLAEIAAACALDVGQPLAVKTQRVRRHPGRESILTLHLPASLAATQHPVWCLACRLACFCPNVRVSVLVECETAFAPAPAAAASTRAKTLPRHRAA